MSTKNCLALLKTKYSLLVSIALVLGYVFYPISISIKRISGELTVLKMPRWEAYCLEKTLRALICEDGWGYTLFGYKAIAFGGEELLNFPFYKIGWRALAKISSLQSEFFVWSESADWDSHRTFGFIAKKSLLSQEKKQNPELFSNLSIPENSTLPISFKGASLQKQEELFGTLLGYGKENAKRFSSKLSLEPVWDDQETDILYKQYALKKLTFRSLSIEDLLLPSFMGNKTSDETILLKEKYLNARKKIISYYSNKPFLETTLSILLDGLPSTDA